MKTEIYKNENKSIEVEFYTDAAELPYHRYMLSTKLAILANDAALSHESVESDISNAVQMIDANNIPKALFFLQSSQTKINFAKQGWMLDLAATFPLIKSIDKKDLEDELTLDKCMILAKKYKYYLPVDVLKKKVK